MSLAQAHRVRLLLPDSRPRRSLRLKLSDTRVYEPQKGCVVRETGILLPNNQLQHTPRKTCCPYAYVLITVLRVRCVVTDNRLYGVVAQAASVSTLHSKP